MLSYHTSALIAELLNNGTLRELPQDDGGTDLIFTRSYSYYCTNINNDYFVRVIDKGAEKYVPYIPRDMLNTQSAAILAEGPLNCAISLISREMQESAYNHTGLSIKFPQAAPEFHVSINIHDDEGKPTWRQRVILRMIKEEPTVYTATKVSDFWDYTRNTEGEQRFNGNVSAYHTIFSHAITQPATLTQAANIYAESVLDANIGGIEYHRTNKNGLNCVKQPIEKCRRYGIDFMPELKTREINHHLVNTTLIGDRVYDHKHEHPNSKIFTIFIDNAGEINFYQAKNKAGQNMLLTDASQCFNRRYLLGDNKYDFHHITELMQKHGYEISNGTITNNGHSLKPSANTHITISAGKDQLWANKYGQSKTDEHEQTVSGAISQR